LQEFHFGDGVDHLCPIEGMTWKVNYIWHLVHLLPQMNPDGIIRSMTHEFKGLFLRGKVKDRCSDQAFFELTKCLFTLFREVEW